MQHALQQLGFLRSDRAQGAIEERYKAVTREMV